MAVIKLMLHYGTKSWLLNNKADKRKAARHNRQELPNPRPDTSLPLLGHRHYLDCMIA
jgi:hypothetical protein